MAASQSTARQTSSRLPASTASSPRPRIHCRTAVFASAEPEVLVVGAVVVQVCLAGLARQHTPRSLPCWAAAARVASSSPPAAPRPCESVPPALRVLGTGTRRIVSFCAEVAISMFEKEKKKKKRKQAAAAVEMRGKPGKLGVGRREKGGGGLLLFNGHG